MAWKERPPKRSYACTSDLLVFLRERKGLTQHELARAAGYSERLIGKAESGQPISVVAIEHLAVALGTDDKTIHPEDLITDPVLLAKEYISALYTKGQGMVDEIRHFLDDNVIFRVAGDPKQIPFAGVHQGISAVERCFEIFFSVLQAPAGHDFEACYTFLGQGNEVRMWGDTWIHPIGKPMEEPLRIAHRFVFQRGKLILFEDIYDTQAGIERLSD